MIREDHPKAFGGRRKRIRDERNKYSEKLWPTVDEVREITERNWYYAINQDLRSELNNPRLINWRNLDSSYVDPTRTSHKIEMLEVTQKNRVKTAFRRFARKQGISEEKIKEFLNQS